MQQSRQGEPLRAMISEGAWAGIHENREPEAPNGIHAYSGCSEPDN